MFFFPVIYQCFYFGLWNKSNLFSPYNIFFLILVSKWVNMLIWLTKIQLTLNTSTETSAFFHIIPLSLLPLPQRPPSLLPDNSTTFISSSSSQEHYFFCQLEQLHNLGKTQSYDIYSKRHQNTGQIYSINRV